MARESTTSFFDERRHPSEARGERDAWKRRCSSLTSEMDGLRARRGGGAADAAYEASEVRELDELRASKASIEAERDAWKRRTDAYRRTRRRLRQRVAELETTVAQRVRRRGRCKRSGTRGRSNTTS